MLRNWFLSCSLVAAMLTGCNKTAPEAAAAPAPGTPGSSPAPADNTAAAKVFEERILPIFKSPDPIIFIKRENLATLHLEIAGNCMTNYLVLLKPRRA